MKILKLLPLWRLTTYRRKLFEAFGSRKYSDPSYGGISKKLLNYVPTSGFFVEVGAVDGFFESNTYYLERFFEWRGILIEPIPDMFRRIQTNRPNSRSVNCALTEFDCKERFLLMSSMHALSKVTKSESENNAIKVAARTLSSILDDFQIEKLDLLCLDVEGFELNVIKGIEERHMPDYMLVECLDEERLNHVSNFLKGNYELVERFTCRDYFWKRVNF